MKARVVYERNDAFDMQSGPYGFERVGFQIGDRVFWTGCVGSGLPGGTYAADKALAEAVVARWNTADVARETCPSCDGDGFSASGAMANCATCGGGGTVER